MKTITFLLHNARGAVALSIVAGVLSGAGQAGLLALIAEALKHDAPSREHLLGWSFVALCVLVPGARILSQNLLLRLTESATFELRMRLARQILSAPLPVLERLGSHRLLAVFSGDLEAISQALAFVPILAINLSILAACLGYLGWLSWEVFLLTLGFLVIGFFTHELPLKRAQGRLRAAREEADTLFRHIRSLTQGTKEIKLHAPRRRAFLERFAATGLAIRSLNLSARLIFSIVGSWGQLLFFLLIGLLLFVVSGPAGLTREVLLGYSVVLLYMRAPLQVLLDRLPELSRANVAVQKIEEIGALLETRQAGPEVDPAAPAEAWQELELSRVVHAYGSEISDHEFVLGPLDLTFRKGDLVFLVGGNGSGKTTLAKLLLGLYVPQAGQILVDGMPVTDTGWDTYRQSFSAVFSDFFLFQELLGMQAPDLDQRAREHLARLQLDHKVRVESGRFSTIDLSQGQRKRLALLTALMEDRPVYLFDEWAADQDPHFKEIFYRVVLPELKAKGKTVFVISHDDGYYGVADRLIKLDFGKIVADSAAVPPCFHADLPPVKKRGLP